MNLSALSQRALGDTKLYLKKHGPAILTGAGVIGFVGTTVLVGRAAVKAKPEIDDIKHDLQCVEDRVIDANWTQKDRAQDYGTIVVHAVRDIGKIYAPSIVVGAISITCIVSAHGMLKQQNTALVAAYGALATGFNAYRIRVADEVGLEKENDLYRGVTGRREIKGENGEVCIIEEFGDPVSSDKYNRTPYGRFFDPTSRYYADTAEYNLAFLISQQNYANDMLKSRGHVFLNEIYDMLGFERSQAGQVVGWQIDRQGHSEGDGYVDFGIHNIADEVSRAFINGLEKVVFLDFNVDGPIIID